MPNIKENVIVIDDSRLILYTINNMLSPFYEVFCFQDQEEAMKEIYGIKPALVLLDIVMPTSGFNVISKLKQDIATRDIPVILMTTPRGNGNVEDEERSFKLGAADFIAKPLKPSIVLARVHSHVNRYKYFRELESISVTDALTGIYNRRGFNEMILSEWSRARRGHSDLSLLMIDIDHFKNYNDNYGHLAGDNTISRVGQAIKKTLLRATDIPSRYGGEEFTVILPGANEKGAKVVAENLLRAVRSLQIIHEYSDAAPVVTVSIGVASIHKHMPNPDALIKTADDMLYKAKQLGRNRFYPSEVTGDGNE